MNSALLTRRDSFESSSLSDPAECLATTLDSSRGFRTPDIDAWGKRFLQIKEIDKTHRQYNDDETPLIPTEIIQGARRLIRKLEGEGVPPPTCMTGTVDATICFEWHEPTGGERFISIDVLGVNQYEIFTRFHDKPSTLEVVTF